jgi:tetratricopeptide (TPR) repeat protein
MTVMNRFNGGSLVTTPLKLDTAHSDSPLSWVQSGRDWLQFEFSLRKRKYRSFSLRAFARLLDISPGHLSDLMNGRQLTTKSTVEKLCRISSLSAAEKRALAAMVGPKKEQSAPIFCGVPPLWHQAGITRPQIAETLSNRLRPGTRLSLFGPVGSGKSFETRRWLTDPSFEQRFPDGLVWFDLGSSESNFERLGVLCEALGLPTLRRDLRTLADRRRTVAARLSACRILIVYDHVHALDQISELEIGGLHASTLLLTRSPEVATRFAPDESHRLPYFSQEEAMRCVAVLASEIPNKFLSRVGQLLTAVDYCPTLVALFSLYWKRRFAERAEWRLERALEETEQSLLPFASPEGLPPNLMREVQSRLLMRSDELTPELRIVIECLSILPASPSSFSKEVACAVGNCSVSKIDALLDAGYLGCLENGRLTLPTGVCHALCDVPRDTEAQRRLLGFFLTQIGHIEPDMPYVVRERANLLAAIAIAIAQRDLAASMALARTIYFRMRAFKGEEWEVAALESIESMIKEQSSSEHLVDFLSTKGDSLGKRWFDALARESFEKAFELAKGCGYHEGELQALVGLCQSIPDPVESAPFAKIVEEALTTIPHSLLRFRALRIVGRQYGTSGEFERAMTFFDEAYKVAESIGARAEQANALDCIASTHFYLRNHAEAFAQFCVAVELARECGDRDEMVRIKMRLASAHLQMGHRLEAIPICYEALALAEEQALPGHEGRALFLLADCHLAANRFDLALNLAERGRQKAIELDSAKLHCEFSTILYEVLCRMRREDEAETHLNEGLERARHGYEYQRSVLLMARLDWLLEIEDWTRLEIHHGELAAEFQDHAASFLEYRFYCIGAHLAAAQGKVSRATECLELARKACKSEPMAIEKANIDWASARFYWLRGETTEALAAANRAREHFAAEQDRNAKSIERWMAATFR